MVDREGEIYTYDELLHRIDYLTVKNQHLSEDNKQLREDNQRLYQDKLYLEKIAIARHQQVRPLTDRSYPRTDRYHSRQTMERYQIEYDKHINIHQTEGRTWRGGSRVVVVAPDYEGKEEESSLRPLEDSRWFNESVIADVD